MFDFHGNGFQLRIPEDWIDQTIYTFIGNTEQGNHWIRATVDARPGSASVGEFADLRLSSMLSMAGTRLLRKEEIFLHESLGSVRSEIRWLPTTDLRLYQRVLICLGETAGVTLLTQLSKKERRTVGPFLDEVMGSIRPRSPGTGLEGLAGFRPTSVGPFILNVPDSWSDQTVYMLTEPDDSQFRRNLVIQRRDLESPTPPLDEVLAGVIGELKTAIQDLEILEECEVKAADSRPATRVVFLRPLQGGGRVRQTQLLFVRGETLFTLTLTTELEPPPGVCDALEKMTLSFFSYAPEVEGGSRTPV